MPLNDCQTKTRHEEARVTPEEDNWRELRPKFVHQLFDTGALAKVVVSAVVVFALNQLSREHEVEQTIKDKPAEVIEKRQAKLV